jgi:hypothetical protein
MAALYGVENWLPMLRASDPTPYTIAKPLVRMATLARLLNNRQRNGYRIAVISALSKESTAEYDAAVMEAKRAWLAKHLASVHFDEIRFVPYTYRKNDANQGEDILFDDEERHLTAWTGIAINAKNLLEGLKAIA